MDKKNITIIILIIALGATIYFAFQNDNKNGVASESLFEKQERCANNRENAKQQLEDAFSLATPFFYDIFYSPKTDTCVYTYGLILAGNPPEEIGSFVIADYYTGEELFSVQYDNSSGDESQYSYTIRPEFTKAVEEYKK
jgi:hypothetical protein